MHRWTASAAGAPGIARLLGERADGGGETRSEVVEILAEHGVLARQTVDVAHESATFFTKLAVELRISLTAMFADRRRVVGDKIAEAVARVLVLPGRDRDVDAAVHALQHGNGGWMLGKIALARKPCVRAAKCRTVAVGEIE